MIAAEVKAALKRRHGVESSSGEWTCVEEAFCGWASAGGGIDVLAIGAWASAKVPGLEGRTRLRHPVVAYEVKVSRADFARELHGYLPGPRARWSARAVNPWPHKAHFALERSHYFFFATPKGLLKPKEAARREKPTEGRGLYLPEGVGLIEVDGNGCHVAAPAARREARTFTPAEVAELIRHAVDPNANRALRARVASLEQTIAYYERRLALATQG